jgi:thiosulfate/3-mercaptopyruvate sulfurtransferase
MSTQRIGRHVAIAVVLLAAAAWSLALARAEGDGYPGGRFLATGKWLKAHLADPGLVVVDVRTDKDFDGRVIPGAARLPWTEFRYDDPARGVGELFVGEVRAQEILGAHGVARNDAVILYDSVARDGGATASYLFWILDLLGHEKVRLLERGIDGWVDAGGAVAASARAPEAVLYQAPASEIRLGREVQASFLLPRLGDPHYQVLDVRSREEYLGEKASSGLGGEPLEVGHIPTAANVDYRLNWTDATAKAVKPYPQLLELYRGADPSKTIVVYCQSGRRASFGYFILRLMGLENVGLYEASWFEWGNPRTFFPAETQERPLSGLGVPTPYRKASADAPPATPAARPVKGGYVSCGG